MVDALDRPILSPGGTCQVALAGTDDENAM